MTKKKPTEILEAEKQVSIQELQKQLDLAKSDLNRIHKDLINCSSELKTEKERSQEHLDWSTRLSKKLNENADEVIRLREEKQALLTTIKIFAEREALAKIWS